jgi:hypothetical protein
MLMASFIGKAMNFWFMSFQVPSWSLKKQISLFRSALSWFRSGSMIFQNASESRVFPNLVVHPPGKIRVQLDHENLFASTACWCQRVRPIGMLMFNDVYSVNLKIWMCMFYWEVHYPGNLTANRDITGKLSNSITKVVYNSIGNDLIFHSKVYMLNFQSVHLTTYTRDQVIIISTTMAWEGFLATLLLYHSI